MPYKGKTPEQIRQAIAESTIGETKAAVSDRRKAYRTRNVAAGKCSYCPRPLAPNSTYYCVECLAKKRDGKRKRREEFQVRLRGRSGEPSVEIVRSPQAISPFTEGVQAMIARLVKERVDEIVAQNKADQPEPDFLPKEMDLQVRSAQDVFERRKWALYFDKWGCRTCSRKNVSHASGGCCGRCHNIVALRLRQIRQAYERDNPEYEIFRQIDLLTLPTRTARELLGEPKPRRRGGK